MKHNPIRSFEHDRHREPAETASGAGTATVSARSRSVRTFHLKIFLLFALFSGIHCLRIQAQGPPDRKQKTEQQGTVNRFGELESEDANPVRIKDSTVLKMHLIGIKWGYTISSVSFSQDIDHKSINTPVNIGIFYTYYHSLWNSMPYFGIQTGIQYAEEGLVDRDNIKTLFRLIEVPLISQFRIDFWKMRLMINAGAFGSYRISTNTGAFPETTNRTDFGLIGGGGLAVAFNKIELQLECNYKYSFAYLYDPKIYSQEHWLFTHPNQLIFNVGIFYRFGRRR